MTEPIQFPDPCSHCGRPCDTPRAPDMPEEAASARVCSLCFAKAINAQGKPADQRAEAPIRLTWHQTLDADEVKARGATLPVAVFDLISNAAETVAQKLSSGPAGLAALAAQASEHGLLVMVIVQPAKRLEQAPPVAPSAAVAAARDSLDALKRRTKGRA